MDAGVEYYLDIVLTGEGLFQSSTHGDPPALRITYGELLDRLEAAGGRTVVLEAMARTARNLAIRVVDTDARPLAGVAVVARPAEWFEGKTRQATDSEGIVRFRYRGEQEKQNPDGLDRRLTREEMRREYGFTVEHPGTKGVLELRNVLRHRPRQRRDPPPVEDYRRQGVPEPRIRDMLRKHALDNWKADPIPTLFAELRNTVRLIAVDETGAPLPGLQLQFSYQSDSRERPPDVTTDASGGVDVVFPSDARNLTVYPRSGQLFATRVGDAPKTGRLVLTFYPSVKLRARLLWPEDAPLEARSFDTVWMLHDPASGNEIGYTRGGEEDGLAFLYVPARPLLLKGGVRNGLLGVEIECDPRTGEVIDIPLKTRGTIHRVRVRLQEPDGKAVTGVKFQLWLFTSERGVNATGTTDQSGKAELLFNAGSFQSAKIDFEGHRDGYLDTRIAIEGNWTIPTSGPWTFTVLRRK